MNRLTIAAAALVATAAAVTGCIPLPFPQPAPQPPATDAACGDAPASFDPSDDVVYAVSSDGCARLERRALDDGTFAPVRLVVHANGLSGRLDVDTDADLTYELDDEGGELMTSDAITARTFVDPCTGETTLELNDGEAVLPVVG